MLPSYIDDQCLHIDDGLHATLGAFLFISFNLSFVRFKIPALYPTPVISRVFIAEIVFLSFSLEANTFLFTASNCV